MWLKSVIREVCIDWYAVYHLTARVSPLSCVFSSVLSRLLGCQMLYLDGISEKKWKHETCPWMFKENTEHYNERKDYMLLLNSLVYIQPLPSSAQIGCWIPSKTSDTQGLAKDQTKQQMENWSLLESSRRAGLLLGSKLKRALVEFT